jgi:predicted neutral ceramidase superfamily lipid hydrolase
LLNAFNDCKAKNGTYMETAPIPNTSGHLILFVAKQFAEGISGWRKEVLCTLVSAAMWAAIPLLCLGAAHLAFGNSQPIAQQIKSASLTMIVLSLLFSVTMPLTFGLHARLTSPLDWLIPGGIAACAIVGSLSICVLISPETDPASALIAANSELRPFYIRMSTLFVPFGSLLAFLAFLNFYRMSRRKLERATNQSAV